MGRVQLYDVLVPLGAMAAAPGYLVRSLRHPEYRAHFGERLGRLPRELASRLEALPRRPVWIQAVSVGEVLLARTLLDALSEAGRGSAATPEATSIRAVLSSTTPAGREAAAAIEAPALAGVFHFPIDWSPLVRRALDAVNPSAYVSIETEIWPALLRQCSRRGVPVIIVNGRISRRSHDRYLKLLWLLREPLQAVTLACMQTEADAERARSIGMDAARVVVTGNMKFDAAPRPEAETTRPGCRHALAFLDGRRLIVAGSTSPGEEEVVLDAFDEVRRSGAAEIALALAPRHRERFDDVARLLERRGTSCSRLSQAPGPRRDVLLVDTLGDLASLYGLGVAAFVGGSLVPRGGQNLIEPAARGVPVVFGPHTDNFAAVAVELMRAGAGFRVSGSAELAAAWSWMLADEPRRHRAAGAARSLTEAHRGATDRTLRLLLPLLG